jgi:hypothetical protein
MVIEVYRYGKKVNQVEVILPEGEGLKLFTLRRLIIDEEIKKIKELYPFAELWLSFESKVHLIEEETQS